MSQYLYYEFRVVDRALTAQQQAMLRDLSSRAQITSTGFVNTYDYGDFKGDPGMLMGTMFDLHLHWASWGTQRFALRIPQHYLDLKRLEAFLAGTDLAKIRRVGTFWVITIERHEEEAYDIWEAETSDRLAALAPIRADVLAGDLRVFYLVWLMEAASEADDATMTDDMAEPLPGIGPLTPSLKSFAEFFEIDPDLLAAAAERINPDHAGVAMAAERIDVVIGLLPDAEKVGLLRRVLDDDPLVATDLRRRVRDQALADKARPEHPARTLGELRARAVALGHERVAAEHRAAEAETQRQDAKRQAAKRVRLDTLKRRGESVWREVDNDIEARQAATYGKAVDLLSDLRDLAAESGSRAVFDRRIAKLVDDHAGKRTFIARLRAVGLVP